MEFERLMGYKNVSMNGGYREARANEPHWSDDVPSWDRICKRTGKPLEPPKTHRDDPIILEVLEKIKKRSDAGMKKYGVPMTREDVDTLQWLRHAQEEAMDFAVYLQRIISDYDTTLQKLEKW